MCSFIYVKTLTDTHRSLLEYIHASIVIRRRAGVWGPTLNVAAEGGKRHEFVTSEKGLHKRLALLTSVASSFHFEFTREDVLTQECCECNGQCPSCRKVFVRLIFFLHWAFFSTSTDSQGPFLVDLREKKTFGFQCHWMNFAQTLLFVQYVSMTWSDTCSEELTWPENSSKHYSCAIKCDIYKIMGVTWSHRGILYTLVGSHLL